MANYKSDEAGIALLAVLLGLVVIGMLSLGLVEASQTGAKRSHSDIIASEMTAFSDAVVLQVAMLIVQATPSQELRIDGVQQNISILGEIVPVQVTSEFGKIDLNAADQDTLARLFVAAGEGPDEANQDAAAVVVWRTGGISSGNVHPFRVISEINNVPGFPEALYPKIARAVTVYSGRYRVDESTAPLLALEALPSVDRLSAESIIRGRENDRVDNRFGEVTDGKLLPGLNITGWAFTIESKISLRRNSEVDEQTILMTGDQLHPYLVLWRTRHPANPPSVDFH